MPQEFKSIRTSQIVKMSELGIGQLGEIVGDNDYAGVVVVKCYLGIVAVYGNKRKNAFDCCWYGSPEIEVRLLEHGEYVKLTN